MIVEDEPEYYVERIENSRYNKRRRRFEYLVRWTGYNKLIWEPAEAVLENSALDDYHARYTDRPRPPIMPSRDVRNT